MDSGILKQSDLEEKIRQNGEKRRVAITVGNNGFIVGANPVSIK